MKNGIGGRLQLLDLHVIAVARDSHVLPRQPRFPVDADIHTVFATGNNRIAVVERLPQVLAWFGTRHDQIKHDLSVVKDGKFRMRLNEL